MTQRGPETSTPDMLAATAGNEELGKRFVRYIGGVPIRLKFERKDALPPLQTSGAGVPLSSEGDPWTSISPDWPTAEEAR